MVLHDLKILKVIGNTYIAKLPAFLLEFNPTFIWIYEIN